MSRRKETASGLVHRKRQDSEFAHLNSRQQYITAPARLSTEGFQNE